MSILFRVKTVFPILPLNPSRSLSLPLSLGDGCGNNAYWVKTNLYTNLWKFPTIPPVRPPCTSAGNAPRSPHTGNMYDSRMLQAMHPPTRNSDTVIGWSDHSSRSDSSAIFYSWLCCCSFSFPGPWQTPFRVGFRIVSGFSLKMRCVVVEK